MHITTLSHFLGEVVYTPEFWSKNFLKFFATKLQPHSLKVSSKKNIFQCNVDYKPFYQNQSKKHFIQTI